ncbi:30S ribosomal protein S16 [Sediminivirga luteola]|uniref:Small ribosomal subunit protein bS16 n=1 Tax=Sediminivirga luteola TaxID=1774748 RepID=A0A8J2TVD0_9MICO|nr:30S ribosomal protein S16 [Sediminivirga luteola]MCI2264585.1 30S ribosomal protein S16 [Sediminivirga luteola]GGA03199.1 30S ribosomal protein S16 [Sediminivirga luteola]
MAVKIRLKRFGKIREPFYRVVVADSRTKRDGRAIEEIGLYHPLRQPSLIEIDSERAQYWLSVGAQPSEQVLNLLKITGDWQKFKGLEGAEGTLKQPEPKPEFKAPEGGSVLKEAITQKGKGGNADNAKAEQAEETSAEDEQA